jgi:hypothetical protein
MYCNKQRPFSRHSRAGGGAVHEIRSANGALIKLASRAGAWEA